MRALMLGDIHGSWWVANRLYSEIKKAEEFDTVIQVGDFGYWPKYPWDNCLIEERRLFIDGNHEHFPSLWADDADHWGWEYKQRGSVEDGILFLGGASSPDKNMRVVGHDWFPEENIQEDDKELVRSNYSDKIHTVISHDCPSSFDMEYACHPQFGGENKDDPNRRFLQEVLEEVKPERWFFGHWHEGGAGEVDGCKWRCLGIIESGDYEVAKL